MILINLLYSKVKTSNMNANLYFIWSNHSSMKWRAFEDPCAFYSVLISTSNSTMR
ncbi:hypothetical protein Hanom_Chr05g00429551 [Helianthus anomalus]